MLTTTRFALLQAGFILPCSAKPLSDCVVEIR
jgi:hypothetical protein